MVVFGGSDDLIEFRGAISDEQGAPTTDDDPVLLDAKGPVLCINRHNGQNQWVMPHDGQTGRFGALDRDPDIPRSQ